MSWWRRRKKANHRLVNPSGPKKVDLFDPSALDADIRLSDQGAKESGRATELYGKNQDSISHPELFRMVWQVKRDMSLVQRKDLWQINWLVPVAWINSFEK